PTSSPSSARTPRASGSRTSRPARSCAPATTPGAPPTRAVRRSRSRSRPRPGTDMAGVYAHRVARARARMDELGVDVLLLSVGPDLPYLTGYEAMPLERLTMLVVARDAEAVLLVPRLEAPRVTARPDVFRLETWDETDDPVARVAVLA